MFTPPRTTALLLAGAFGCLGVRCEPTASQETDRPQATKFDDQVGEYVTEAIEDSNGHLWFGTLAWGAARLDGETLTYFTEKDGLSNGPVTTIVEDKTGTLWFGTHGGVSSYDGTSFSVVDASDGLTGDNGNVQVDRSGQLWASTADGVFRHNGESFSSFHVPVDPTKISSYAITAGDVSMECEDQHGHLWFSTDGYGALKFDGTLWTRFSKEDGLCSNNVNGILEDPHGRIWFICMQSYQPSMTGDGGACRLDGDVITRFPDIEGLSGADLYSLELDRSGNVWMGATGVGIYRYANETFTLFDDIDRRDLTPNVGITAILEDRHGTMWFGLCGGVFRLEETKLVNVPKHGPWR